MRASDYLLSVALLCLAACAPSAPSPATPAATSEPRVRSELLVATPWLAARLDDPRIVVLHVSSASDEYDRGHIPGARFLPLSAILAEQGGNINELPPIAQLDSVFTSLGVGDEGRIILYGAPLAAARAFFTLDVLGHGDRTALLGGGLEQWRAEGRPVSTEAPRYSAAPFTPRPRAEVVVDAAWVREHLGRPGFVLLDARPQAQYSGAEPGAGVPRPGHIPGARNLFWEELLVSTAPPVFRDPDALRARFRSAGVQPGDTVVAYCRTGMQASVAYFVARYLGYETRMYDGSFLDWSRRPELPVER